MIFNRKIELIYDKLSGSPRWKSVETVAGQGFEKILNFYN